LGCEGVAEASSGSDDEDVSHGCCSVGSEGLDRLTSCNVKKHNW
jgi:hypothetical protein